MLVINCLMIKTIENERETIDIYNFEMMLLDMLNGVNLGMK